MAKQSFLDLRGLTSVVNKLKQFVLDNKVEVDDELSSTSTNPVQNKIIVDKLAEMQDEVDTMIWSGTQAEYEEALAQGLIKDGTLVNITDDYDEYEPIESNDIVNLFKAS
jgi:hypothetical protein